MPELRPVSQSRFSTELHHTAENASGGRPLQSIHGLIRGLSMPSDPEIEGVSLVLGAACFRGREFIAAVLPAVAPR